MKTLRNLTIMLALGLVAISCNKEDQRSSLTVKMTDAPGDFLEVNVEVEDVMIHYEDEPESEWIHLETNAGIYDLLKLQNDVSVVIADQGDLPVGHLGQMRLILGDENTVVTAEGIFPLELSSQDKTGLKINIDEKMKANKELQLLIDFDAEKSIVLTGNGAYKLKPVIKLKEVVYVK